MKLSEHTEHIRQIIEQSFQNRLGRMGVQEKSTQSIDIIPSEYISDRLRIDDVLKVFVSETGTHEEAFEKLVEELTFTLFNRIAALKVMEAHVLQPEVITRQESNGGRSFAHLVWLEQYPEHRGEDAEGLVKFIEYKFQEMSVDVPLFSLEHPYHLLPTAVELLQIIEAFNAVDTDPQVEDDIWKSDDVLGWLYESYNNYKKDAHKASGEKTEYNKVSIQSQVYTPRWVVQFLVDNSLGKLYMEMYPDSEIKDKYKIANVPEQQVRDSKPLHEIRLIDPAMGSGNFELYAFDLFYDLYKDQIENYGADYDENEIAKLIIENNLYGVDLDDRAAQLTQLGLYIKAKRKRRDIKIEQFNVVSSDFYLPEYSEVRHLFENGKQLDPRIEGIIVEIWEDLQHAYKFGSLIRLEEKFSLKLHGLVLDEGVTLFTQESLDDQDKFRDDFFTNLQKAIKQNRQKEGITFLNSKTKDALTFLQILTQKYDVAVANPPYTDSSSFGPELKKFIDHNYKKPYKFNTNLYASFIKRCFELTYEDGKLGLIHPLTFMYIKTFEDVRSFILQNTHINVFVDYGLSNLFGAVMVDPAFYVLEKNKLGTNNSCFVSLNQYTRTPNEKYKKEFCLEALDDYFNGHINKHNIILSQDKLKIIDGWPFIYWISDGFREKFKEKSINDKLNPRQGIATGNNDRCVRFWWEIRREDISKDTNDKKKWKVYSKGGPFNKWFGNFWTVIDYSEDGYDFLLNNGNHLPSRMFYFLEGVTYTASGSKGVSFRLMPKNQLFDVGGSCIFPGDYTNIYYYLAFLNSVTTAYIANSLNPTVNIQVGDIKRVPFVNPSFEIESNISSLSIQNIDIKRDLYSYNIIEMNFNHSPLISFEGNNLNEKLSSYFNYENTQLSQVLINEAIINELIFEVYELSGLDREQVEAKEGKSVGGMGIWSGEFGILEKFIEEAKITDKVVLEYLRDLPLIDIEAEKIREIKEGFTSLYQSNNDLEEFCILHQINPINVWYLFKNANVLPKARGAQIALEFLADTVRALLEEDDDGIIPMVSIASEDSLSLRLEQHCLENNLTAAQYLQLDGLLGRPLNEYLENHFFNDLGNHLKLFMYLPKTPFIWHLSSGEHQGFEAYVSIYKWNRDSLYKLKSQYISKRRDDLQYRQIQLQDVDTAQAQNEKDKIHHQLQEVDLFEIKIDELISEGYDPKLDDGVAKNIAPLQHKGLLRAEVLKTTGRNSELNKYLNADW